MSVNSLRHADDEEERARKQAFIARLSRAVSGLPPSWTVVSNDQTGRLPWSRYVALHRERGLALVDIVPVGFVKFGLLAAYFAGNGVNGFLQNKLPIIALTAGTDDLDGLEDSIEEAFAETQCLDAGLDWVERVTALLVKQPGVHLMEHGDAPDDTTRSDAARRRRQRAQATDAPPVTREPPPQPPPPAEPAIRTAVSEPPPKPAPPPPQAAPPPAPPKIVRPTAPPPELTLTAPATPTPEAQMALPSLAMPAVAARSKPPAPPQPIHVVMTPRHIPAAHTVQPIHVVLSPRPPRPEPSPPTAQPWQPAPPTQSAPVTQPAETIIPPPPERPASPPQPARSERPRIQIKPVPTSPRPMPTAKPQASRVKPSAPPAQPVRQEVLPPDSLERPQTTPPPLSTRTGAPSWSGKAAPPPVSMKVVHSSSQPAEAPTPQPEPAPLRRRGHLRLVSGVLVLLGATSAYLLWPQPTQMTASVAPPAASGTSAAPPAAAVAPVAPVPQLETKAVTPPNKSAPAWGNSTAAAPPAPTHEAMAEPSKTRHVAKKRVRRAPTPPDGWSAMDGLQPRTLGTISPADVSRMTLDQPSLPGP